MPAGRGATDAVRDEAASEGLRQIAEVRSHQGGGGGATDAVRDEAASEGLRQIAEVRSHQGGGGGPPMQYETGRRARA